MTLRKTTAVLLLAAVLLASACAGAFRDDRMWIPDRKYNEALELYDSTGSLVLTEEQLQQRPTWQNGEVNEAIYRLRKQFAIE